MGFNSDNTGHSADNLDGGDKEFPAIRITLEAIAFIALIGIAVFLFLRHQSTTEVTVQNGVQPVSSSSFIMEDVVIPTLSLDSIEHPSPSDLSAKLIGSNNGVETHYFTAKEAVKGFIAPSDAHILFDCPADTKMGIEVNVAHGGRSFWDQVRYWGYEYSGDETQNDENDLTGLDLFDGRFWLSQGERNISDTCYGYLHTMDTDTDGSKSEMDMVSGARYYLMVSGSEDVNGNGVLDVSEDLNDNCILDTEDVNCNSVLDPGEDLNGNGVLDLKEDVNGNCVLDLAEDANQNGVLDMGFPDGLDFNVSCRPLGDTDKSGILSSADSFLIIQHVLGIELLSDYDMGFADVDGNGEIQRADSYLVFGAALSLYTLPRSYADLDDDGEITNAEDLEMLIDFVAGTTTPTDAQKYLGDLNMDKKLDDSDVTILNMFLAGEITMADVPYMCSNGKIDDDEECDDGNLIDDDMCTAQCTMGYELGDVDMSGILSSADAFLIIQHVLGVKDLSDSALVMADVDLNGEIQRADAYLVVGAALNWYALPRIYGDIDNSNDPFVSNSDEPKDSDSDLLKEFVAGTKIPTDAQRYLGNMNADKEEGSNKDKLDENDEIILQLLIDEDIEMADVPYLCSNGIVDVDGADGKSGTGDEEECDDGNLINGDGCSDQCLIEVPVCGNGVVEVGEQCDDGNEDINDGCFVCTVEDGWSCKGEPSVCTPLIPEFPIQ